MSEEEELSCPDCGALLEWGECPNCDFGHKVKGRVEKKMSEEKKSGMEERHLLPIVSKKVEIYVDEMPRVLTLVKRLAGGGEWRANYMIQKATEEIRK